jgi:hypothetical protein
MGNNPVNGVDPDGAIFGLGEVASGMLIGGAIGTAVGLVADPENWYYYTAGGVVAGALAGEIYRSSPEGTYRRGVKELAIDPQQPVPETDEFLKKAQKAWFPKAPMDKIDNFTVEKVPQDIRSEMNEFGSYANTRPSYGVDGLSNGRSSVYFNSGGYPYSSFQDAKQLFRNMGHEFVHVSQYSVLKGATKAFLEDYAFKELVMEHFAYSFDHKLGGEAFNWGTTKAEKLFPGYVKKLNWTNFPWTNSAVFKYPF